MSHNYSIDKTASLTTDGLLETNTESGGKSCPKIKAFCPKRITRVNLDAFLELGKNEGYEHRERIETKGLGSCKPSEGTTGCRRYCSFASWLFWSLDLLYNRLIEKCQQISFPKFLNKRCAPASPKGRHGGQRPKPMPSTVPRAPVPSSHDSRIHSGHPARSNSEGLV